VAAGWRWCGRDDLRSALVTQQRRDPLSAALNSDDTKQLNQCLTAAHQQLRTREPLAKT